jgi:hypothetical protein
VGRRKQARRARRLEIFHESLWRLAPEYKNTFLCPICRNSFPIDDPRGATEAHVVPIAAGGTRTTFLCFECNSEAGRTIDKWFGEALNVERCGDILRSKYTDGRLVVNDISVGGRVDASDGKTLQFILDRSRSNPKNFDNLVRKIRSVGVRTIDIKFDLMGKRAEAALGALQAGYLMLVYAFGYVPVFQKSLDVVRDQLRIVRHTAMSRQFMAVTKVDIGVNFGMADIDGRLAFFSSFGRRVCFYPILGDATFYDELPRDYKASRCGLYPFKGDGLIEGLSTMLKLKGRYILFPDALEYGRRTLACASLEEFDRDVRLIGVAEYGEELNLA